MSKKKNENKRLQKKILSLFKSNPRKVFNYRQISGILDIKDTIGRNNIIRVLNILNHLQQIKEVEKGKFIFCITLEKTYKATLHILPTGKGKVHLKEKEEEFLIPKKFLNRGLDGDLVTVSVHKREKTNHAHVEEIIKRKTNEYVGVFERNKDFGFVLCTRGTMYTDIFIQANELKNFRTGEKVVAIVKSWDQGKEAPNGKIIKSLGTEGETDTEVLSILHEYGLPYKFPHLVEKAAKSITYKIDQEENEKRRDFRKVLTFTIDPQTAKDFDDALSFKKKGKEHYEIGIHIADVSHYVKPNSLLDKEAYERGTSVYLVDRVVPMLPETLSNNLCSLKPKEEKYTFSAVFTLDKTGEIIAEWYGKTVINSDHRFSYEEVQYLLDKETRTVEADVSLTKKKYIVKEEIFEALVTLDYLAKKLRNERIKKGAISFERVEVNFNLDQAKKPESIFFKTSKDSNKLIEEFMLLANKKVASLVFSNKSSHSFVYRVHDYPDEEKLLNLKQTVASFGYNFKPLKKNISKTINNLLKDCNGKKEQNLIDTLILRSMSKAEYSTNNIGHFGLAFSYYTHFTSPIRRYPDILVHRLLQAYLQNKKSQSKEILEESCKHSSFREQLATKAERESIKYMQMVFMQEKIGKEFFGVISGITDRGIYVEIIENKCEGMIRLTDFKTDFYHVDIKNHSIVGKRTNKVYHLGDSIKIKVKKVNVQKRFLDLTPVEQISNL